MLQQGERLVRIPMSLALPNFLSLTAEPAHHHPNAMRRLSDLAVGECGVIQELNLQEKLHNYVTRFGFIDGAIVSVVRRVPLGNLSVYRVGQAEVALRPETAEDILVVRKPK
jgi:Fe2+ transport system protein FeoA